MLDRTASRPGPFAETDSTPLWVLLPNPRMGLKWLKSGFRLAFDTILHTKNPLVDPFEKPILNPLEVEINCSPKKRA